MRTLSLQERNILITELRDRIKTFLAIEGDPFDHCRITMQESSGEKVLDVLVDCHAEERRDKIKARLQSFGFPNATNAPVRLVFTSPEWQPIISIKAKEEQGVLADQTLTDEIFNLVRNHFREKGWKHLVVKGDGFIRVQTKEMARKAGNLIKTLSRTAEPFCTGEDVLLYPKSISQPANVDTFIAYLKNVIGGVFKFKIMEPIRDGNSIIIGFGDEKELEETEFWIPYLGFQKPHRKNQTLIFLPEKPSISIEEVQNDWETKTSIKRQPIEEEPVPPVIETFSEETASPVSPDEFKKDVRDFLKKHNIHRIERGTIQEVDHFHYKISIEQEHHEKIMDLAKQEHPEWLVEKARRSDTAMNFFHSTYYTQPSSLREHHEPETVKSTQALKVTGEGITVTLQMIIPEEKMQEIMKQAPDNFITKEAQERGLFSSRKEILDTITEEERALLLLGVTNAELIAEAKRRGSDFAKQMVMGIL